MYEVCVSHVYMQPLQRKARTFQKQGNRDLHVSNSMVAWLYVEEYKQFRVIATEAQMEAGEASSDDHALVHIHCATEIF